MPGAVVTVEAALFAVTVVAWFLLELRRALHRRTDAATEGDRSSLALLRVTTPLGFLLAVLVALLVPAAAVPAWLADGVALLLLWCGIAIRWWSIRALGDYFTYTVQTSSDQRVVDTGPYRWVRHPAYLGMSLAFLGVACLLANWLSVLVLAPVMLVGVAYRIRVEEAAMTAELGEAYSRFAASRKRLVPGVW